MITKIHSLYEPVNTNQHQQKIDVNCKKQREITIHLQINIKMI